MSVCEARAQIVLEAIVAHGIERIEDVGELPRFACWTPRLLCEAIDVLVADGRLQEDETGKLVAQSPFGERAA